jgi:SAM-dependent methyltransferase
MGELAVAVESEELRAFDPNLAICRLHVPLRVWQWAPSPPNERQTMTDTSHWEGVYRQKSASEVSWYQPHLKQSLLLISEARLPTTASIVDVGGGASTLVDDLLGLGYTDITVIDLAASALVQSKERLGDRAESVRWLAGDATTDLLASASVDLWHDRAVFHFLTDEARRMAYIQQVERCVRPGKFVVLSTFAPDGPERCSGLPVARYSPDELAAALGPAFEKLADAREHHTSPSGAAQSFSYVLCRRR